MTSLKANPRARALPLGAQFLWHRTVDLMRKLDQCVLQFAEHIPSIPELAGMLDVPEPELETYLPSLQTWGLLVPDMRGALYAPLVLEAQQRRQDLAERRREAEDAAPRGEEVPSARLRASRENGLKGGRPRSCNVPRQRQMPLMQVVPGSVGSHLGSDLGSSCETQRALFPASALAKAEAKTQTQVSERTGFSEVDAGASTSGDETHENLDRNLDAKPRTETHDGQGVDVVALARDLRALARMSPPEPTKQDQETVHGWLTEGLSPTTICDKVRGVADATKRPIGHLGYFKKAMATARVMQVAQAGGSASGLEPPASSAPRENARLRPQQPGESQAAYERRLAGYTLNLPQRTAGESDRSYRRRVLSSHQVANMVARGKNLPELDWAAIAAEAGVPEDEEAA